MLILVDRFKSNIFSTISNVSIDGEFQCFGLEDEHRIEKLNGETRIPVGSYRVTLRTEGGFHNRYKNKFPDFHEGMLWVRDVPNFEYILIHIGNTDDDTAGCLLVGSGAETFNRISLSNSTKAYKDLYKKVLASAKAGSLNITYIDND